MVEYKTPLCKGSEMPTVQETVTLNPQIKIVVYRWINDGTDPNTADTILNQSERIDVSSRILSCTFSKNLANPTGTFSFDLANSPGISSDWKDVIKPGSWVVIYMSQEGDLIINPEVGSPNSNVQKLEENKRLRCVGYVDRVSAQSSLDDSGAFDLIFSISGRDFGVVYEDSNLWQNIFEFDKVLIDRLKITGLNILGTVKIHEALKVIHDLLLYPLNIQGAKVNDRKSLTTIGLQWLLPRELVQDVFSSPTGFPGETFWGNIPATTQFHPTEAALAIESPTDFLWGNLWSNLKQISVPELHELFTETNDVGEPRLTFRPIPWAINKEGYPTQGEYVQFYKDVDVVEIPSHSVFNFDLGESNSERFNSFLTTVITTLIGIENNISILRGSGFPFHDRASIKRNGFRPMHISAHALVKNQELANGASDAILLREFNHLLQDYWENAHLAESGSAQIVGNNEIKVGLALKFGEGTPYVTGKRFYIEGYVDTFSIGDNGESEWNTSVFLTRGFEETDLLKQSGFTGRNIPFNRPGDFTRIK